MADERETVVTTLFSEQDAEITMSVDEFREWIEELAADVPAEHRDNICISFDFDVGFYDSPASSSLQVFWERPETDEEVSKRIADKKRSTELSAEAARNRELRLLQELERKYRS